MVSAAKLVQSNSGAYSDQVAHPLATRPDLHEFLFAKIPAGKLTTGKRVIDISESQSEVTVTCMDETTYVGHMVVGADGAYSATRQIMYQKLTERGQLPEADKMPLHFDKQCVVGAYRSVVPCHVVNTASDCGY